MMPATPLGTALGLEFGVEVTLVDPGGRLLPMIDAEVAANNARRAVMKDLSAARKAKREVLRQRVVIIVASARLANIGVEAIGSTGGRSRTMWSNRVRNSSSKWIKASPVSR